MIKLNLSNGFNLLDYGLDFNKFNVYLGYVKTRGFVFVQERNDTAFFNCIESNVEPDTLYNQWGGKHEPEENKTVISKINTYLTMILKKNVDEYKLADIRTDIIDALLSTLRDKFESYEYTKPKSLSNQKLKEFALNPVEEFNTYLDNQELEYDEYFKQSEKTKSDIKNSLEESIKLFNESKGVYGLDKNGEYSPLISEKQFIRIFNEVISDAFDNPIVNLMYGNGKVKLNTINAIDYITEEFNIKGVYKNGVETIYYFNDELNYFEPLTEEMLKNIIIDGLGLKLLKSDYSNLYKSLETNSKEYNNLLVFKNMLYDMLYMEELNYPICNYNRREYLAPGLIGYEDNNNKIQLLNYDEDLDYLELYNTDPNDEDITFVEKTLRQILVPKDNPNDLSLFHDFLQRVGSCILGVNKYKVITLYYGEGNNGKGILKLLMELVFNKGAYSLTPQTFDDAFNLQGFTNRKVLLLDEIDKHDFKDLKPTLKRISSPEGRVEQRIMHKADNIVLNNFPMLFIFANVLINLKLNELALFSRFDFLKLPNSFVTQKELDRNSKNRYLLDRETESKIKADTKGLSWFITASIEAFKRMQDNKTEFLLRQTIEQTMDILLDTDYLTKFIYIYTYDDDTLIPTDFTTVDEIYQQYLKYMELNGNIEVDNDITVKRRIGTTIKNVYNITGKLSDSNMYHKQDNRIASYRISLKSFKEVDAENNRVCIINENVTDADLSRLDYSREYKLVYDKIQNGVNTINLLNKDLPMQDNQKIVKELLDLNLITMTTQTNILNNSD